MAVSNSFHVCADTATRIDSLDGLAFDYMAQTAHYDSLSDSVKAHIDTVHLRIAALVAEKYDILGITEDDVIAAENEMAGIRQELELMLGLTPDALAERSEEIDALEAQIDALKTKPYPISGACAIR